MTPVLNASIGLRLLPRLGKSWRRWANRRDLIRACDLVPAILTTIPPQPSLPPPTTWRIRRVEWTLTDVVVIGVGPPAWPPVVVLKLPQTDAGVVSLQQQQTILTRLRADSRLDSWHALLPAPLAKGEIAGQAYFVERALPGCEARLLMYDPIASDRLHRAAATAIVQFHRLTAATTVVDESMLERWIDQPLRLIGRLNLKQPYAAHRKASLERLATELRGALAGRTLSVSWIHGDFWASNLLVTADGAALSGIVDWDRAEPSELPMHDVLHLLVQRRKLLAQHREPGDTVRALLKGAGWSPDERALLDLTELPLPNDDAGQRAMLLLYWLRCMAVYLTQSPARACNEAWVANNIEVVVQCL
jgi:hypothetical protein